MRLSVVTVCWNAADVIGDCLESVRRQHLPAGVELEHVIVDGASSDRTLEIVRHFADAPAGVGYRVISEPDRGLYDAMNKGIAAATGEAVGILNADDFYASAHTLAAVAGVFRGPGVDASYGDLVYVRDAAARAGFPVVRFWRSGRASRGAFSWGWMPPHPTFWVRKSIYERVGAYRLDLGTAADYEMMVRIAVREAIPLAYVAETLVCMRDGGASNVSVEARVRANQADRQAWSGNGLKPLPWTFLAKPARKIPQWFLKPRATFGRWWETGGPA